MSKILIIEDDIFLAELLIERLKKKEGLDVSLALDAEKGLSEIKANKPALILLDLVLPGMSGYEFLKTIKADKDLASIPIMVLSNLGQRDEIERAMQLGAKDFLVKANLDLNDIVQKVKRALEKEVR